MHLELWILGGSWEAEGMHWILGAWMYALNHEADRLICKITLNPILELYQ